MNDALTFINREIILKEDLKELDLRNVSEIKKTDKGIEVKFCDRIKAINKLQELLGSSGGQGNGAGLLDAILLSAEALGRHGSDDDAV